MHLTVRPSVPSRANRAVPAPAALTVVCRFSMQSASVCSEPCESNTPAITTKLHHSSTCCHHYSRCWRASSLHSSPPSPALSSFHSQASDPTPADSASLPLMSHTINNIITSKHNGLNRRQMDSVGLTLDLWPWPSIPREQWSWPTCKSSRSPVSRFRR